MTSKIVKGYYKNIDKCPKLLLKFEQKDFIMFNSLVEMLFVTIYVKDNRSVSNLDSFLVFFWHIDFIHFGFISCVHLL